VAEHLWGNMQLHQDAHRLQLACEGVSVQGVDALGVLLVLHEGWENVCQEEGNQKMLDELQRAPAPACKEGSQPNEPQLMWEFPQEALCLVLC